MNIFPITIRIIALIATAALVCKLFRAADIPWGWIIGAYLLDAVVGFKLVLNW